MNRTLKIENLNDKQSLIKPVDSKAKSDWKDIIENIGGSWKVNKGGWILSTNKVKELKEMDRVYNEEKEGKEELESLSDDSDDSYESSTDDEMVQKVLARRLKSESTQDEIPEENISDSENEDVLSVCRRLRHMYREINSLKEEIKQLKGGK